MTTALCWTAQAWEVDLCFVHVLRQFEESQGIFVIQKKLKLLSQRRLFCDSSHQCTNPLSWYKHTHTYTQGMVLQVLCGPGNIKCSFAHFELCIQRDALYSLTITSIINIEPSG